MGIAWLLLRRTFSARPKRTLLFLLGYALTTAVMITLLSVGHAVLEQARDKDLLGGGDLILVPQGIDVESMKVGGITALYYSIPQARFIVRQILHSSRFKGQITEVSPLQVAKVIYACKNDLCAQPEPVTVYGSLPDPEQRMKRTTFGWKNTPGDNSWENPSASVFYPEIDHFHLPSPKTKNLDRWAEWHYFNFESPDFYGYLSLMAAGDPTGSDSRWILSLQLFENNGYHHYATKSPLNIEGLPLTQIHYRISTNTVDFVQDHYEIGLSFTDKIPISGKLKFYPAPGLYLPPTYLAKSEGFESGYAIPAIRGRYEGSIQIGDKRLDFDNLTGYHDHNWGIWQAIHWNWGHAFSDRHSIFFGEIYLSEKSKGVFAGIYDDQGFLTVIRPEKLNFSDYKDEEGYRVPMHLSFSGQKNFAAIQLDGRARSFVATRTEDNTYFIQYKMDYRITLGIDGKQETFAATGNAETYVPSLR
ncbi:MAG TPA: hypothetical protein VFG11_10885 [Acidobacteriota bacterium]|nr:hypothetical protein [Acidobacteriota bacterium]